MTEPAVEIHQLTKTFGPVIANDTVDFIVKQGEIHALLGENGAGKSTLMSMLCGLYRPDRGSITIHGNVVDMASPGIAAALGIGMVYQNFRLVPTLTAMENIILGEQGERWRGTGWKKRKIAEIMELCTTYGLSFPVDKPVWQLSVGERQRVEIVKTLYRGADIIILDEPTSVLTPGEADQLFLTMEQLRQDGKSMIITTHKMREVMAVADVISVMRKGKMIATMPKSQTNEHQLAKLMVGREMKEKAIRTSGTLAGDLIMEVQGLTATGDDGRQALQGLDLHIRRGEIVGIAGVAGNGQKELAEVLTGLRPRTGGTIEYNGKPLRNPSVRKLIDLGIAHIPEDRMKSGLAGALGATDNLLFKSYRNKERSFFGILRKKRNIQWSRQLIEQFDVSTPDESTPVRQLSGGNQQKLLFAREIDQDPNFMVAVHPTQGLDVGATQFVHGLLLELREKQSGVLLISEDLDELMSLCDRIVVLYDGKASGEVSHEQADKEQIGMYMAGVEQTSGGEAV